MASIRQEKLASAAVDNIKLPKPLNKKELVVSVGYSELSGIKKASEILNSKGVKEELKKLGFDKETAKEVVGEIVQFGENDNVKLKAADMIFKAEDVYAPEKHLNANYNAELNANEGELRDVLIELLS